MMPAVIAAPHTRHAALIEEDQVIILASKVRSALVENSPMKPFSLFWRDLLASEKDLLEGGCWNMLSFYH
jgi:hypothetical protein